MPNHMGFSRFRYLKLCGNITMVYLNFTKHRDRLIMRMIHVNIATYFFFNLKHNIKVIGKGRKVVILNMLTPTQV